MSVHVNYLLRELLSMQTVHASLAWLTFVLICGLLEFRCGHTAYDLSLIHI